VYLTNYLCTVKSQYYDAATFLLENIGKNSDYIICIEVYSYSILIFTIRFDLICSTNSKTERSLCCLLGETTWQINDQLQTKNYVE